MKCELIEQDLRQRWPPRRLTVYNIRLLRNTRCSGRGNVWDDVVCVRVNVVWPFDPWPTTGTHFGAVNAPHIILHRTFTFQLLWLSADNLSKIYAYQSLVMHTSTGASVGHGSLLMFHCLLCCSCLVIFSTFNLFLFVFAHAHLFCCITFVKWTLRYGLPLLHPPMSFCLHCALSCGAVYCNRPCLFVCVCLFVGLLSQSSPNWVCRWR